MAKTQKPSSPPSASSIKPDYNGVKENDDHPPHDVMKAQMAEFPPNKGKNPLPLLVQRNTIKLVVERYELESSLHLELLV